LPETAGSIARGRPLASGLEPPGATRPAAGGQGSPRRRRL